MSYIETKQSKAKKGLLMGKDRVGSRCIDGEKKETNKECRQVTYICCISINIFSRLDLVIVGGMADGREWDGLVGVRGGRMTCLTNRDSRKEKQGFKRG
jgi:hypothetical protein